MLVVRVGVSGIVVWARGGGRGSFLEGEASGLVGGVVARWLFQEFGASISVVGFVVYRLLWRWDDSVTAVRPRLDVAQGLCNVVLLQ